MTFCLIPQLADKFTEKLRSGEIDPKKLNDMSSAERNAFFKDFLGEENAAKTNALFESKLLLKNQKAGFISWAKQVSGMKPEVQRDMVSRINKMNEALLTPADKSKFMEDLAAQKLGVSVTSEEAAKIAELAKRVAETKEDALNGKNTKQHADAVIDFQDYLSDLKNESRKLTFKDLRKNPVRTTLSAISNQSGFSKAMKSTLDNSAILRQGLKSLFTSPKIWAEASAKTFSDMFRTLGGKDAMREIRSEVISRKNNLSGKYKRIGVDFGSEEQFPTSWPEKIPGLGRFFKGSEAAFKGFQYRTRADLADYYIELAEKTGQPLDKDIGKLVNSLTGRGHLGRAESLASATNKVLFSPRYLKSNIDLLTAHALDKDISPFVRKEAAKNMVKVIAGIAGVLTTANAVMPGSVEWDPRSSDFGKIKVGDTRFDVTGGMASIVTLIMRILRQSTKSTSSGQITKIDSGDFGAKTSWNVISDFFYNKTTPLVQFGAHLRTGKDRDGNPITAAGELKDLYAPMPITNFMELQKNPNAANALAGVIFDGLGAGTNTYSKDSYKR